MINYDGLEYAVVVGTIKRMMVSLFVAPNMQYDKIVKRTLSIGKGRVLIIDSWVE